MGEYVLTCDAPVDIAPEHLAALGVTFIPFHFTVDGTEYTDDLGMSMPLPEFYRRMAEGADIRTSQANRADYEVFFEEILKQGKDILHLSFSSGLSGSYNSACMAAEELMGRYPERKICAVDSLGASAGFGLFVDTVAHKKNDEGMDMEALRDWATANRLKLQLWFLSADLTYYIKGGRISRTAGTVASALGICPLMHMDAPGHLVPVDKLHTKKKTLKNIVRKMLELAEGGADYSGKCFLSHSDCPEDAAAVAEAVEATFPKLNGKVLVNYIGASVGAHTGPGTIAMFYWGADRAEE